jgi:hypothetical protein
MDPLDPRARVFRCSFARKRNNAAVRDICLPEKNIRSTTNLVLNQPSPSRSVSATHRLSLRQSLSSNCKLDL